MCFKIYCPPDMSNNLFDILRLFLCVLKITMQTARRRHIPPLPIEDVLDHPVAQALPVAAYGMLMRIIMIYWHSECRPLPKQDVALALLAMAHRPTWAAHRTDIKDVLSDITPKLERAWHTRTNRKIRLAERGLEGASARRLDALRKKTAPALTIGETITTPRVTRDKAPAMPAGDAKGFRDRG